jgi:IclR family transcriptional regulator, acetate operon repressor
VPLPAPPPAYLVDAADKALQLVLLLQGTEAVSVSEAAAHLGVARSTAHRLLTTLRHRGFAVQSDDRRYRAGPALHHAM